jgi:hypothetical protein
MKKTILASVFLILTSSLCGQEFKISFAPTINCGLYYKFVAGGSGQNLKMGLTTSIDYVFLNGNNINLGLGFNYHLSQVEFVPNLNTGDMQLHTENVNLISVRFKTVYKLKNHFYFSLDPSVDFHLNYNSQQTLDKQSGIGLSFGFGKDINIKEIVYLNIEPRIWIHNIISFTDSNLRYHLTTLGLNLGLVFGSKHADKQTDK